MPPERLSPSERGILDLIERDMAERPWRVRTVDRGLHDRAVRLVEGVDVDLGAPLDEQADDRSRR